MDWQLAISRNRDALLSILSALFLLAGLAEGQTVATLPRHIYRAILRVLRPAESAVRRLIIIAAHGLVLASSPIRTAPVGLVSKSYAMRLPAFALIDPLKRFVPSFSDAQDIFDWDDDRESSHDDADDQIPSFPRISLPGFFDPVFRAHYAPASENEINAAHLMRRLGALKRALETISVQARRLARWQGRRNLALQDKAAFKPTRLSPFRPGSPPGARARRRHEVDHILRECHHLMLDMLAKPDTS